MGKSSSKVFGCILMARCSEVNSACFDFTENVCKKNFEKGYPGMTPPLFDESKHNGSKAHGSCISLMLILRFMLFPFVLTS